jgi:lysophospholipase L1-like esterase
MTTSRRLHPRSIGFLAILAVAGLGALSRAQADTPPTIFVVGDSTAHNDGLNRRGQQMRGWGTPLANYFDPAKATVANVAHAGQSSRTYYRIPNDWPRVLPLIKAGDYVLLVFGINDGGPPRFIQDRGSIPGLGDETVTVGNRPPRATAAGATPRPQDPAQPPTEVVHTYGWYMSAMANEATAKGAHVYLLTVTVRNIWTNPKVTYRDGTPTAPLPADYRPQDDRIERGTLHGQYTAWTKELGQRLHLPVLDLTNLCADLYERMGREAVNANYSDHNHTFEHGADIVAASVVAGLKAFPDSPFEPLLSAKGRAVAPAAARYVSVNAP